MKCLFLDLASHDGLLACIDGQKTVSAIEVSNRTSDAELLPLVADTLKKAGWEMKDIQRIACVTGPGGFTSQRVAVTLGNTLAWGLHVPIAGVHLSDLYKARTSEENVVWIHSTKKTLVFIRGFGEFEKQWPEAIAVELSTLTLPADAMFVGELLPEHEEQCISQGGVKGHVHSLSESLPAFVSSLSYDEKPLEPWYGRGY